MWKPQMSRPAARRLKRTLTELVIVGALFRLALMFTVPLYPADDLLPGYNDEPLHLHYVDKVRTSGRWPVYRPTSEPSDSLQAEFMQSPLYYFLAAPVSKFADAVHDGWGLYGARLVSVVCGLLAALFAARTAMVWSGDPKVTVGVLTAMLLAPNAVLFTSIVTNDALLLCTAALAIHSLALCRTESAGVSRQVLTGVFLASAVWAKLSGLTLFPLAWFAGRPGDPPQERWLARLRVLVVALLLVMPLYAWNLAHYGQVIPGGVKPLVERYAPQSATGFEGGALRHPAAAVKFWARSAAQPFFTRWGSLLEKATSLAWVVWWGGVTLFGALLLLGDRPRGTMFILAVVCVAIGFIWRGSFMFQVEFRLFAPAFPALAVLTSRAAATLRVSPTVQAVLWVAPVLIAVAVR